MTQHELRHENFGANTSTKDRLAAFYTLVLYNFFKIATEALVAAIQRKLSRAAKSAGRPAAATAAADGAAAAAIGGAAAAADQAAAERLLHLLELPLLLMHIEAQGVHLALGTANQS
jgi:hypothetical protein